MTSVPESQVAFIEAFILRNSARLEGSGQLVFAVNRDRSSSRVTVFTMEKEDGIIWRRCFHPFSATIGERGFAPPGKKKERDGKSPSGVFPLGIAFGYEHSLPTRMDYRQVTENDFWVDDVDSDDYNRWVTGQGKSASMEPLRRDDNLYKYGIVIRYNMDPVVKGKGSAIFIHLWKGDGEPTFGCVAMAEENILGLLGWLDPEKKPLIVMGTETELERSL